jgi:TfoX/Sxy family transcriptional regulator of competence genes
MDWEKSSATLIDLFTELAPKDPRVQQKKMFGWPSCFVNGNLFTGLHKESVLLRLSEKDQAACLRLEGTAEFEPMPGRKMKGYVVFSNPLARDRKELSKWIAVSLEYASALPVKAKAKKK